MTEAVDNVAEIHAALDRAGIDPKMRWIHADAALSGIPLALRAPGTRPAFDISEGTTSIAVSGHKFLAVPFPCGVVVARSSMRTARHSVAYTAAPDTTLTGSRSGHAPLWLWYLLRTWGLNGLRTRAARARELAQHTVDRLTGIGWPAWRHEHAFTVVLQRPPQAVLDLWPLAVDEAHRNIAHIVCMPGKTRAMVDRFVADLERAAAPVRHAQPAQAATSLHLPSVVRQSDGPIAC
jgi:histidine decarboxylase